LEILEKLSYWRLSKNDSAPWSYVVLEENEGKGTEGT
jgi:hypothetical protein